LPQLRLNTRPIQINRLADRRTSIIEPMLASARQGFSTWHQSSWTLDTTLAPDVTDRKTVINLALMAANTYINISGTEDWEDADRFNSTLDFGWEANGLRGHIYADETNSTVIIGIKGTSRALFDGDQTTTSDKENDNLFFSCCCAEQGPWTWHKVCDCASSTYTCNSTCLIQNLHEDHRYYQAARYLYSNVTGIYPNADVWVTGHSLGGAVSALLGLTYGLPTVTFEAPGDALPASRLGIPTPPGSSFARPLTGVYHFGHTADPIYMGLCDGSTSTCSIWGYAFQSQCHSGMMCTFDSVSDNGTRVAIWTHGIREVIKDVLRKYESLPDCIVDDECRDCYNWIFYHSNSSTSTTSTVSSSTRSRTRTSTCETPGWWGCRDKTSVPSTTTTTEEKATTTCHTPGWFGCKDKTTSITTSATLSGARVSYQVAPSTTGIKMPSATESSAAPVSTTRRNGEVEEL
jgi:lipase ATG15